MQTVVIGMDPHKRSATIGAIDQRETVLHTGRYGVDQRGYERMLAAGRQYPQRVWAVEGCSGVGRNVAQRLAADGETVVDVPAKLSARVRVLATGQGRKSDAVDAHSVAVAALRAAGLREVHLEGAAEAVRLLVQRRNQLGRTRIETLNRIHSLLADLIPGGASKALSAARARTLLQAVNPSDLPGRTRHALASEQVTDLEKLNQQITHIDAELAQLVTATGSTLPQLTGIGAYTAARLIGEIGDINRFPSKAHFASFNGTAPLETSSGQQTRHRLSRAGNRRLNHALHIMAVVQLRHHPQARTYYQRKLAEGKTTKEAIRCLKRRLSDQVYKQMTHDAKTGPGGQRGTTLQSSATGPTPTTGTSEQSQPEPATTNPKTTPTPTA